MYFNNEQKLIGFALCFTVLVFGAFQTGTALDLNHDTIPEHDDFANLTMDAQDQPMVDNLVSIRVTYNHSAVVMIHDGQIAVGHGIFAIPGGHGGHGGHGMQLSQSTFPSDGISIHVLARIFDTADVVGKTLTATVFKDHQGDGMVNGSDSVVLDSNEDPLVDTFILEDSMVTTIEVQDQEISLDDPYVIIDRLVVPGPAWHVIHGFDNGALGPQYGIKEQLRHGVNIEVQYDLTSTDLTNLGLEEAGDSIKVFAHLHHDIYERGYYNGTTDPHIFSPQFDDEILGNDSAMPFTITVAEDDSVIPLSLLGVTLGIAFIAIYRRYSQ